MGKSLELVSTGPHESVRTDWLSPSFRFTSADEESDLFAYFYDLGEKVLPVGELLPPRSGKHYQYVYSHQSGLSIETSPLDSTRSTRGSMLVNLPGSIWGALDAQERNFLITDIRNWPGFYRVTRWDPQITVLQPPLLVEELVNLVEAGKIWVAGFSQQNPWGQRKADGSFTEPPSQYFGSPSSDIRVRIYDHGAKHGWLEPSLRVEVQIRKQYATDHFHRLARRCQEQRDNPPLLINAEEITVKDALAQHADIRDTSRWAGRERPKKWRQAAPVADWWEEMLQHRGDPAKLSHRPEVSFARARAACHLQYGRKLAKGWMAEGLTREVSISDLMIRFFLECCGHLQQTDLLELLAYCKDEEQREWFRKAFHTFVDGAEDPEAFAVENPLTPPSG